EDDGGADRLRRRRRSEILRLLAARTIGAGASGEMNGGKRERGRGDERGRQCGAGENHGPSLHESNAKDAGVSVNGAALSMNLLWVCRPRGAGTPENLPRVRLYHQIVNAASCVRSEDSSHGQEVTSERHPRHQRMAMCRDTACRI